MIGDDNIGDGTDNLRSLEDVKKVKKALKHFKEEYTGHWDKYEVSKQDKEANQRVVKICTGYLPADDSYRSLSHRAE